MLPNLAEPDDEIIHMPGPEARRIREALGWSQAYMGRAIGLDGPYVRQSYNRLETEGRRFSYAQAELIRAYEKGYRSVWMTK